MVFAWVYGARFENLIGSHLLKYCHYLHDTGYGDFDLRYLRDKEKTQLAFNLRNFFLQPAHMLLHRALNAPMVLFIKSVALSILCFTVQDNGVQHCVFCLSKKTSRIKSSTCS